MATVVEIPARFMSAIESTWRIGRRHVHSTNPWTHHVRAGGAVDERWLVDITLPAKFKRADLDEFEAIFDQGDGLSGYYSAFDAVHAHPRGTAAGTVTLGSEGWYSGGQSTCTVGASAVRGARYVSLTGLVASQAVGFARGDTIAITQAGENYGFLHRIIADVATDANGDASVQIAPRLREGVAAGALVRLRQARGVFMLSGDDAPAVTRGGGGFGQPVLQLVEAPEALSVPTFA